jgi:hypothetical protein
MHGKKAANKQVNNIAENIHLFQFLFTIKITNISIFSIFSENKITKEAITSTQTFDMALITRFMISLINASAPNPSIICKQ